MTPALPDSSEVAIIGGGLVGCAAAYYLTQQGASVVLIEQNGVGSGASGRSGGGVRQSARAAAEIPLAIQAVALFSGLADELGLDIEYVQRGNLRLVESVDYIRPMQVDIARQQGQGLNVRWLEQSEVCELAPALQRESLLGASFCPTDGHANPLKVTAGFAAAARRRGARILTGCSVTGFRQLDSGLVQLATTAGRLRARNVIIAAGAGTARLCQASGFDLPLANMRYESLVTEAVRPLFDAMFGVASADLFFRQTRHGSVHFGGGLVLPADDETTTQDNLAAAAAHLARLVPALAQANLVRTWGGLDPSTPDGIPIIDCLGDNLLVATGFCGHGFALGPVVGRLLAAWVTRGQRPAELAGFERNRFAGWLQTRWTPTGSFEAVLAAVATQANAPGPNGAHSADPAAALPQEGDGPHVLVIDPSMCTGCRSCEVACAIHHDRVARPTQLRIQVAYERDDAYSPIVCLHCEEAYCMEACPFEALARGGPGSVIQVVDKNCTGCLLCVDACPYGGISYADDKGVVIKCDLCDGQPACAAYCAPGAIRFRRVDPATWDGMKQHATQHARLLSQGLT
ncbi:MAG: FAD-dependent oxidoreductase [Anaerolineales bacterium]|nr:FAD-dependent oxidoreductase [Anaerolineales bacterium]